VADVRKKLVAVVRVLLNFRHQGLLFFRLGLRRQYGGTLLLPPTQHDNRPKQADNQRQKDAHHGNGDDRRYPGNRRAQVVLRHGVFRGDSDEIALCRGNALVHDGAENLFVLPHGGAKVITDPGYGDDIVGGGIYLVGHPGRAVQPHQLGVRVSALYGVEAAAGVIIFSHGGLRERAADARHQSFRNSGCGRYSFHAGDVRSRICQKYAADIGNAVCQRQFVLIGADDPVAINTQDVRLMFLNRLDRFVIGGIRGKAEFQSRPFGKPLIIIRNYAAVRAVGVVFEIWHFVADHRDPQHRIVGNIFFLRGRKWKNIAFVLRFVLNTQIIEISGVARKGLRDGGVHLVFQLNVIFAESEGVGLRKKFQYGAELLCIFVSGDGAVHPAVDLAALQGFGHIGEGFILCYLRMDGVLRAPCAEIRVVRIGGQHADLHAGNLVYIAVFPAIVVRPYNEGTVVRSHALVGKQIPLFPLRRNHYVRYHIIGAVIQVCEKIRVGAGVDEFHVEIRFLGNVDHGLDIHAAPHSVFILIGIGRVVEHGYFDRLSGGLRLRFHGDGQNSRQQGGGQ